MPELALYPLDVAGSGSGPLAGGTPISKEGDAGSCLLLPQLQDKVLDSTHCCGILSPKAIHITQAGPIIYPTTSSQPSLQGPKQCSGCQAPSWGTRPGLGVAKLCGQRQESPLTQASPVLCPWGSRTDSGLRETPDTLLALFGQPRGTSTSLKCCHQGPHQEGWQGTCKAAGKDKAAGV